jgi:hypothetical protein
LRPGTFDVEFFKTQGFVTYKNGFPGSRIFSWERFQRLEVQEGNELIEMSAEFAPSNILQLALDRLSNEGHPIFGQVATIGVNGP